MSKSDENVNAFISLKDDQDTILRKFRRAVTDSEAKVRYAEGKDGINNLMEIYGALTGKTHEQIEDEFTGKGYGDFKTAVGEAVAAELCPIQERLQMLMGDKAQLEQLMKAGARACKLSGRPHAGQGAEKDGVCTIKVIGLYTPVRSKSGIIPLPLLSRLCT